jgi:hypothetical protein
MTVLVHMKLCLFKKYYFLVFIRYIFLKIKNIYYFDIFLNEIISTALSNTFGIKIELVFY